MADARLEQGPLEVGRKFLKFVIQEQIGRGGHAWVYRGHDPFLENDVAIKILHQHGGATPEMLRRGQAEAKLLFRLRHPNIVEVQDAGISDDGLLYIVMELLRGKSLRQALGERGRLPVKEALALFRDLASGVEAAHAFGAIHRDLKPENVFLLADGSCKILDFGIAKVVDAAGITTERDIVHGTILYIAPEVLEGFRATPESDLYALGLMLFEVLYGKHPLLLKSTNPTLRELSLMQIGYEPPPLDALDPSIPAQVARLVERLLVKSPKQRLGTTAELRAALGECLVQLDERRTLAGATHAHTAPPLTRPAAATNVAAADPEAARRQSLRSLLSGASVGALLGAAFLWIHSAPAPAPGPAVTASQRALPFAAQPSAPVEVPSASAAPVVSRPAASNHDTAQAAPPKPKRAPRTKRAVNPERELWIE